MATAQRLWTVEERDALPDDGRRYEIIDGQLLANGVLVPGGDLDRLDEIVTPAPSWPHQRVATALYARLAPYLRRHRAGDVLIAPADIAFTRHSVVQPDVFAVPLVEGRKPSRWEDVRRLLLAVEIVSPSTGRIDRVVKRKLYQRQGVPEYWAVDLDARVIERWRSRDEKPEILADQLQWLPEGVSEPLVIDIPAFFVEALGE